MRYLRNLYWMMRGFKRDKLVRKPFVIIRRESSECWTVADREWLNYVVNAPIWQKLMRFADDSLCQDILGDGTEVNDVDWIRAMATGRHRERNFIMKHAGMPGKTSSVDPDREDYFKEGVEGKVDTDDRSDIQEE